MDECKLPDVQNRPDSRGISLERVGLTNLKFPTFILRKDGAHSNISADVELFANLPKEAKGHNLSRFSEVLVDFGNTHNLLSSKTLPDLLKAMQDRLVSRDVYARFEFDYFIDKEAPVSKKIAPMPYRCAMTGIKRNGDTYFILEVNVIAASLCPCSKEMSLLNEVLVSGDSNRMIPVSNSHEPAMMNMVIDVIKNSGMGSKVGMGAHNQRSQIRVRLLLDSFDTLWIEDIVKLVEDQASAPTFPILKRPDEKWITEKAYNNPKFSEDIARDVQIALQNENKIFEWSLKVRNEESIHPYDVCVVQQSENWNFH